MYLQRLWRGLVRLLPLTRKTLVPEILQLDQFRRLLQRERNRADRVRSQLSLVVLDLGAPEVRSVALADILMSIQERIRETDSAGWFDRRSIGVLLPETGAAGAMVLAKDLNRRLFAVAATAAWRIYTYPEDSMPPERRTSDSSDSHRGSDVHRGTGLGLPLPSSSGSGVSAPMPGGRGSDSRTPSGVSSGSGSSSAPSSSGSRSSTATHLPRPASRSMESEPRPTSRGAEAQPRPEVHDTEPRAEFSARPASRRPDPLQMETVPLRSLLVIPRSPWTRLFDITVATLVLLPVSPIILLAAIAVRLTSPGPAFFRQERMGRWGRTFTIYKLRSMYQDADKRKEEVLKLNEQTGPVFKCAKDPRITPLGRFLRRTSIDELPQLWNVLKGDMSIVGPRPPLPSEVKEYKPWQLRRLEMQCGLTCIWQVSGRSQIKFDDWVRLDIRYGRMKSLWFDLRLLARTLPAVLTGRGAT